jgi:hypothetical protein
MELPEVGLSGAGHPGPRSATPLSLSAMAQTDIRIPFTDYKHFTIMYFETEKAGVRNIWLQLFGGQALGLVLLPAPWSPPVPFSGSRAQGLVLSLVHMHHPVCSPSWQAEPVSQCVSL